MILYCLYLMLVALTGRCVDLCVHMGTEEGDGAFSVTVGRSCYQCEQLCDTWPIDSSVIVFKEA